MFFRKKGEDPWDWKPERKRGQAETPQAQPSGETQDWSTWKAPWESEDAEDQSPPPMTCPWCGGAMRLGYLVGGRDLVRVMWERPGTFRLADPDGTLYLRGDGGFWSDYKQAWHCETCRKLVVDTTGCDQAEHPTSEEINRRIIYGTNEDTERMNNEGENDT